MPDAGRNRTCAAPSPAQAAPSQDRANYKEAAEVSKDETQYNPGDVFRDREKAKIASRKERFAKLNRYVTERHGWLTSIPGAREVELQTLPDSTLPGDLERLGYRLEEIGETERILPSGITERFARGADGELVPITQESTRAVAETRLHAGIVKVKRYAFEMP
jgi:hypothetical protein